MLLFLQGGTATGHPKYKGFPSKTVNKAHRGNPYQCCTLYKSCGAKSSKNKRGYDSVDERVNVSV